MKKLIILSFAFIFHINADVQHDIDNLLDGLHEDAHNGNYESYFDRYTSDAVFLGTDKTERWTIQEFKSYAKPAFSDGHGWTYKVIERNWEGNGDTRWFDEILFNEKLSEGLAPEIAVFVDGLNDFYYFNVPNISGASKKIRKYFNRTSSGVNLDFKFLNKSYFWMYLHSSLKPKLKKIISDPEGNGSSSLAQPDSILLKVIDRLRFNFLARQSIGDINGVKVLNVLQPVPGYGIGHKTSKVPTHLLRLEGHVNSARGYQLIEEEKFNLSVSYLDLSSLSIDEPMYIDTVHYSPEFNKQIAERISDMINNSFIEK